MEVNKVEYDGTTLIDLTGDTVTAAALPSGVTAHDKSGNQITGTADYATVSYVNTQNALKVDKVTGKGLSTNDYTNEEKAKLAGLENYDDTDIQQDIDDIQAVIPSTATSSNKLATASDVSAKQNAITQSSLLTLTVAGWDSTTLQQTVTFAHDTNKRNVIDITLGEIPTWGECGVVAVSETAAGITFQCEEIPESALTFKVTSMEVSV